MARPREQQPHDRPDEGTDESEKERLDRNLMELLGELRVALPGVQVLFAFLLTVPFSSQFPKLTDFERNAYFTVLALTAISTMLLIAPTSYHRLLFREGHKREIVTYSNRIVIVGLGMLALAMTGAVLLIAEIVFGTTAAIVTGAIALLGFGGVWYLVPLEIKRRTE